MNNLYKKIFKEIKKYNTIVLARHIGADPDALGSQFALKDVINKLYPEKQVYTVGNPASRFKFLGELNKPEEEIDYSKALLIVLDVPDIKRIDGIHNIEEYGYVIKIDHHPQVDDFGDIKIIDEDACSTCQMLLEIFLENKIKLDEEIGKKLFLGIVSDTDRFLHDYTSQKTFQLVSKLIKYTNLEFTKYYSLLYMRPLEEIRFQGYIYQNMKVSKNGVASIKITDELMKEFDVDTASAGNMVNTLKNVEGILIWIFFTEDIKGNIIKVNLRSRGPYINELAAKYGGGGHKYASGVRLESWEEADSLLEDLEELAKNYKE